MHFVKRNKTKVVIILSMIMMLLLHFNLYTHAAPPPDPGCDPGDPTCPIDGGIGLLIAVGLGLRYQHQQKSKR